MEVIPVRGIVIRAENGAEGFTRAVAHFTQEAGLVALALPIAQNRYAPTVLEHEPGDIDRIAGGMFAPWRIVAIIHSSARERAVVLDPSDGRTEDGLGSGHDRSS